MLPAYAVFNEEICQIENYVESINCYNAIISTDVSKSHAKYKNKIIDLQKANNGFNKRKYDYTVIIVNLYGCFEQYIENFIKDYLTLLVNKSKNYSQLPKLIIDKHIDLSIMLMNKIEHPKYNNFLSKESIIKNLNDCIQYDKCSINYDAFCQHISNFRVNSIIEVLKNIGLSQIVNDIKRNKELKDLYIQKNGDCNYDNLKPENVFSFLNELADRRNQIAHGAIDDILSIELQIEMIKQVRLFTYEMDKIGFEKVLPYLLEESYKIDKIYNQEAESKLLCFELSGTDISIGDIIIKERNCEFTYCMVVSIEVEHVKHEKIKADNAINIGVMLDCKRKTGEDYWIYHA